MTTAVLREQAKSARVTGTAGALVVSIAFAMMVLAAPSRPHQPPHVPAGPPAVLSARTVATFTQSQAESMITNLFRSYSMNRLRREKNFRDHGANHGRSRGVEGFRFSGW